MNFAPSTIWTGDNLYVMRGMNSKSVDLIYLDPPFNSKVDYAAPIGSQAAGAAFRDTWSLSDIDIEWIDSLEATEPHLMHVILAAMTPSDKAYLVYMAMRLLEMRRLLKPTGSIYLHCDPTMSHYLKLVMDAVFGRTGYRNEIVWRRGKGATRTLSSQFPRNHDCILWYTKTDVWTYQRQFKPYAAKTLAMYRHDDDDGRGPYRHQELRTYGEETRQRFRQERRIAKSSTGREVLKQYLSDKPGVAIDAIWDDIGGMAHGAAKEHTGYPTQKPLALLDRIIRASSSPGDLVLDPFCGCATTMVAAHSIGDRKWVGIDISPKAAELVVERITRLQGALFTEYVHREDVPLRTDLGVLPPYNCTANRQHLYGRQGGHCAGCREHFVMRHLEVDHVIARTKGGTDHINNLQLLCAHCNRVKGNRGMQYLRLKLQLVA